MELTGNQGLHEETNSPERLVSVLRPSIQSLSRVRKEVTGTSSPKTRKPDSSAGDKAGFALLRGSLWTGLPLPSAELLLF